MAPGLAAPLHRSPVTASRCSVRGSRPDPATTPCAPDSLAEDTVDYTARFLEAQQQVGVRVPVLPLLQPPGPAPAAHPHRVHPRLHRVGPRRDRGRSAHPGPRRLPLARRLHRPAGAGELPGAGASSAEYYLDGLPYVAAGVDSVAVDPALFSISFLDRIEVERWPGLLRVHLFTRRHDRLAPAVAHRDRPRRRRLRALRGLARAPVPATGSGSRWPATTSTRPPPAAPPATYSNTQVWLQGNYIPTQRRSASSTSCSARRPNRRPFVVNDPVAQRHHRAGLRRQAHRRAVPAVLARGATKGLGPGSTCSTARTGWDGAGHRAADQSGRRGSGLSRADLLRRARRRSTGPGGPRSTFAAPSGGIRCPRSPPSAEAVHQRHYGGRNSDYVALSAGLQPVRGLALTGSARIGEVVAAPAITADTAQEISRLRGGHRVESARGSASARLLPHGRRSVPSATPSFPGSPRIGPVPETEWVTAAVRLAPLRWFTLEGWYSDPRDVTPGRNPADPLAGRSDHSIEVPAPVPQRHLRPEAPVQRGDRGAPASSAGTRAARRSGSAAPPSIRSLLQIQLQSFSIFWDRGNLSATELDLRAGVRDSGVRHACSGCGGSSSTSLSGPSG